MYVDQIIIISVARLIILILHQTFETEKLAGKCRPSSLYLQQNEFRQVLLGTAFVRFVAVEVKYVAVCWKWALLAHSPHAAANKNKPLGIKMHHVGTHPKSFNLIILSKEFIAKNYPSFYSRRKVNKVLLQYILKTSHNIYFDICIFPKRSIFQVSFVI